MDFEKEIKEIKKKLSDLAVLMFDVIEETKKENEEKKESRLKTNADAYIDVLYTIMQRNKKKFNKDNLDMSNHCYKKCRKCQGHIFAFEKVTRDNYVKNLIKGIYFKDFYYFTKYVKKKEEVMKRNLKVFHLYDFEFACSICGFLNDLQGLENKK